MINIRQDTPADAEEPALARAVGMEPRPHRQRRRTRLPQLPATLRPPGRFLKFCSDTRLLVHLVCH